MFSRSYIEKSSELPNGQIHAKIFDEASWIYKKDEFPFCFFLLCADHLEYCVSLVSFASILSTVGDDHEDHVSLGLKHFFNR